MTGLADIARAAGVSISTVSRVLNRRAGVNEATRQRVLGVLADLPYTPRGLGALQRTGVIGLLVPELSNPVFPAFAEALETRAARAGYGSLLCNTRSASLRADGADHNGESRELVEEEYVRMLLARGVEGMVFVSPEITNAEDGGAGYYGKLLADGVQMVFVNGGAPALDVPDVTVDEQVAGYLATRHLVELGHRRIGFVCGPARSLPSRLKRAGWSAALEEAGLPADPGLIAHAPYGAAGGATAMSALLAGPRPSAVICSSDHMALGAMREAHRRGLSVPADLSIVGFDDIPLAAYCSPALTTLAQPIEEMARAAVDELVQRLNPAARRGGGSYSRVFRPKLVVRESTAPPS
ncbi:MULTISPECIES: LacI family DNA-binding transcriptional regulator [unclassified Crossiella]|uniref:LacI family DNA-binding transcriptional regulator n=1 Tax=unclassified Crossiella TaxID=2620835 RepID=UPI001FFEF8EA|nr:MULTISPECIES: LacI family DNA-binding transcriptional regulator [unclassified Crossiella]MCK2237845.1 LacI family transcriptional regulator [Crossiella sp. S99.2]MCK2255131.1 LacI family transcriptional regulator [Crossiella sp. S99.1]